MILRFIGWFNVLEANIIFCLPLEWCYYCFCYFAFVFAKHPVLEEAEQIRRGCETLGANDHKFFLNVTLPSIWLGLLYEYSLTTRAMENLEPLWCVKILLKNATLPLVCRGCC